MDLYSFTYYISNFKNKFYDLKGNERLLLDDDGVIVRKKDQLIKLLNLDEETLKGVGNNQYFYHPNPIAQGALGYYDLWLEKKSPFYLKQFWKQISWLEKNGQEYQESLVYPIPFILPSFSNVKNWVSGMYQGIILSALVRAAAITNENKYFNLANKVYNSFNNYLGNKYGFKYRDKYGLWFEEAPKFPPNHILNGYIFSIWGLYDYYKLIHSDEIWEVWQECINTLKNTIHLYDAGFWSYYNLNSNLASYKYHINIHIPQLKAMYRITNIDSFREMAERWEKYSNSFYSRFRKKMFHLLKKLLK
jgi:hypothetical protein